MKITVWGDFACFTRPEMKVERVSYEVMTPSAARGVLEAVLWKPGIRWIIHRIDVLKPIKWMTVRRNELESVASGKNAAMVMKGGEARLEACIEEERQQRAALILRDVAYTIHARFELTDRAGRDDNEGKFLEMFRRRVAAGQCFNQPYLGCREFSAFFGSEPPELGHRIGGPRRDLGWMLHDLDYATSPPEPRFFHAYLEGGTVTIPPFNGGQQR